MKKIILVLVFAFSMIMVNAQEKDQFTKDTNQLVETISESAFNGVIDQISANIPADKKEAFTKEIKESLVSLYADIAVIYKEEFTHDEIKDMLAFYATPTGKKLAEKSGVLTQKGMAAGQKWGMGLQTIMAKYQ